MIFQKRMSIAHSIMLLVTLLFVLTTRGVRLDDQTIIRSGARPDFSSPASSPSLKRIHSMQSQQELAEAVKALDPQGYSTSLGRLRGFDSRSEGAVHSAPTTPAGVIRTWNSRNSPPPSSLNRHIIHPRNVEILRPGSSNSDLLVGTSRSLDDDGSQDESSSIGMEEEEDGKGYPTPLSTQE